MVTRITDFEKEPIEPKVYSGFRSFDPNSTYSEILNLQEDLVLDFQKRPQIKEVYKLVGEHPRTFTCGKSISPEEFTVLKENSNLIDVVATERGGKIMYHGPGQLTLYFIFNLKEHFKGPRDYVDSLFESVKQYFMTRYEVELKYEKQGLWFKDKKVGFMGIRVKKGVVYHGISLNYFTDLKPFMVHSPCDIQGEQAGNIFSSQLATLFLKDEAKSLVDSLPFF